jgi:hypothetical protein
MLDPKISQEDLLPPSDPFDPRGRSTLQALRLDAGVIHRRLRRIADEAPGGLTTVEDLDRVAEAVAGLHRRIVAMTLDAPASSLEDVVAARHSIHRSLELVQEVADEVLAH